MEESVENIVAELKDSMVSFVPSAEDGWNKIRDEETHAYHLWRNQKGDEFSRGSTINTRLQFGQSDPEGPTVKWEISFKGNLELWYNTWSIQNKQPILHCVGRAYAVIRKKGV